MKARVCVVALLTLHGWAHADEALDLLGLGPAHDMIAFSSSRHGRPQDIYLVDRRGGTLMNATNASRPEALVGPIWDTSSEDMATLINVFRPYYDALLASQEYSFGFSVERTGPRQRLNLPDSSRGGFFPASNIEITQSNETGTYQIYKRGPARAGRRLLTSESNNYSPIGCGGSIVFLSDRTGQPELFSVDAEGSHLRRLAAGIPAYPAVCAPSGDRVAMFSGSGDHLDVYVVELDGSGFLNLTHDPVGVAAFSWAPDGQAIAFESRRDGNSEIYAAGVHGEWLENLTNDPAEDVGPAWLNSTEVVGLAIGSMVDESSLRRSPSRAEVASE